MFMRNARASAERLTLKHAGFQLVRHKTDD